MNERERKALKDRIVSLLMEDRTNRDYFHSQIEELSQSRKQEELFFSNLLELFVHIQLDEKEALEHWQRIIEHCQVMTLKMERNVGLRVAMVDYFMNLNRLLSNPMLIEIHIFKQTEKLAMIDGLTGIFNRRYMDVTLKKEFNRSTRYNKEISLVIIDLDNFKYINDNQGHPFGDRVLKEFAQFLTKRAREEDVVCRYGGEEFVIILPETSGDGALNLAERMRKESKSDPFMGRYGITFSAGIATYPACGKTVMELVASADRALYQAKYSGKDRIIKIDSERRKHERFRKVWSFIYYAPGDSSPECRSEEIVSQDVSFGGVRFETRQKMDLDVKLVFEMKLSGSDEEPMIVLGKVIWVRHMPNGIYSYGVEFYDLSQEHIERLKISLPPSDLYTL